MNRALILGTLMAAGTLTMKADFPLLSNFVSTGHAIEIQHGDLNKKALQTRCNGVALSKSGNALSTTFTVEGFYNGNFDVDFSYLMGKSSPKEGPFAARETKPDGSAGDYAGKYLTIERGIAVNTQIGAIYFSIPDTLGLKTVLTTMLNLSTSCDANSYGGYDLKFKTVTIEGSTLETLLEVFQQYGDSGILDSDVLNYVLESSDVTLGAFKLTIANEDGSGSSTVNMEGYDISTYAPNATVTDKYYTSNTATSSSKTVDRAYSGLMTVDEDGSFSLLNFSNRGYAIASSVEDNVPSVALSGVNGTIDWESNTFTLENKQQIYLDLTYYNSLTSSLLGSSVINKGVLYAGKSGLLGVLSVNSSSPQVSGNVTYGDETFAHSGINLWAKSVSGGDLSTTASGVVNLEIPTYCAKWDTPIISSAESHTNFVTSTIWSAPAIDRDVTLDVDFSAWKELKFEYDAAEESVSLSGAVAEAAGNVAVDHYEVYLHHKEVTRVAYTVLGNSVNTSDYSAETGLTNAYMIASTDETGKFSGEVAVADIPNNNSKPLFGSKKDIDATPTGDDFSIYIKAVYEDETLAPTFHALTTVKTSEKETGVNAVASDAAEIIAGYGRVEVAGAKNVQIYGVDGSRLYDGMAGSIPLPAGIYMVKADSLLQKVVVR